MRRPGFNAEAVREAWMDEVDPEEQEAILADLQEGNVPVVGSTRYLWMEEALMDVMNVEDPVPMVALVQEEARRSGPLVAGTVLKAWDEVLSDVSVADVNETTEYVDARRRGESPETPALEERIVKRQALIHDLFRGQWEEAARQYPGWRPTGADQMCLDLSLGAARAKLEKEHAAASQPETSRRQPERGMGFSGRRFDQM
jgi:hypothetical protein